MERTYVYTLTVGTHDDADMLGIYRSKDAAKQDAERRAAESLVWDRDDEDGAHSQWDLWHEPYTVQRWPLD